jgi:predicted nucleic acid-binding protein
VLYVDSSAFIKHYIRETGTDALEARLKEEAIQKRSPFISTLGYAEILATFARRSREGLLGKKEAALLLTRFEDDWMFDLTQIELSVAVLAFIPRLVRDHPLKASDAIHLASALWLRDAARLGARSVAGGGVLTFATSDRQLRSAASGEGLAVFEPQSTP